MCNVEPYSIATCNNLEEKNNLTGYNKEAKEEEDEVDNDNNSSNNEDEEDKEQLQLHHQQELGSANNVVREFIAIMILNSNIQIIFFRHAFCTLTSFCACKECTSKGNECFYGNEFSILESNMKSLEYEDF
jgi:hypothetical protein